MTQIDDAQTGQLQLFFASIFLLAFGLGIPKFLLLKDFSMLELYARRPFYGLCTSASQNVGHAHRKLARKLVISKSRIGESRSLPHLKKCNKEFFFN
jgi:hypothetical protein